METDWATQCSHKVFSLKVDLSTSCPAGASCPSASLLPSAAGIKGNIPNPDTREGKQGPQAWQRVGVGEAHMS